MELQLSRGQIEKKDIPFPSFGDFLCNSLHGDSLTSMEETLVHDAEVSESAVCFLLLYIFFGRILN